MSAPAGHIVVVGFNHRSAAVSVRERMAFRTDDLPDALAQLRNELGMQEAAILSTCNRGEIYAAAAQLEEAIGKLRRFLGERGGGGTVRGAASLLRLGRAAERAAPLLRGERA